MRRALNVLLVVMFLGLIAAPPIANLMGRDGADPDAENRMLAPFPAWSFSWTAVKGYLPGLNAWFTDHFGFRARLVELYGVSRYLWLGVSPTAAVATGSRGWLYYAEDGGVEDFTNAHPMTDDEMQRWRTTVVRAQKWCRTRGIAYVFVVLPDKSAIYPEYFPQTARRVSRLSRIDQVITAIADTGAAVDVRQPLLNEKRDTRIYQKTDTHWNQRGAYVGYQTVIDALRLQAPSIPPSRPRSEFEASVRAIPGLDLAAMMGLKRILGEEDLRLTPKAGHRYVVREPHGGTADAYEGRVVTEIPGSPLPRALVFRDSFMSAMAPYVSDHFGRVVYLWRNDFAVDEIEREQPDVVIQEIVGRHLQWFVPSPELIPEP